MAYKTFIIGRNPNVTSGEIPILINDPTKKVSSNHCRISYDGANYFIEDLISTNGTFVDGARINNITNINVNSVIRLGNDHRFSLYDSIISKEKQSNGNNFNKKTESIAYDSEEPVNLSVGFVLIEGFNLGIKNMSQILISYFLWWLTFWIPYINVGTTIAMTTLPVSLSKGHSISFSEIFDSKYRKIFGEFYLLMGLIIVGIMISLPFLFVPAIVLGFTWSQALLILVDKHKNITECLTLSNKITYGYKWSLFFINFLTGIILFFGILILVSPIGLSNGMGSPIIIIIGILIAIYLCFWIVFRIGVKAIIYSELSKRL